MGSWKDVDFGTSGPGRVTTWAWDADDSTRVLDNEYVPDLSRWTVDLNRYTNGFCPGTVELEDGGTPPSDDVLRWGDTVVLTPTEVVDGKIVARLDRR